MNIFVHVLYYSDDSQLPTPNTYFLIDFEEISRTVLAKVRGALAPKPPVATSLLRSIHNSYDGFFEYETDFSMLLIQK